MSKPRVEEVQERNRIKSRVQDTATCIIAEAVERAMLDPTHLRKEYGISEVDWPGVLMRLQEFQRRIDPYGDW